MANNLCLQYGSHPDIKRVYIVAIHLLVPYMFATSHSSSHSGQTQPMSHVRKSYTNAWPSLRVLSSKPSGAESTCLCSSVTCLHSFITHAFCHPHSFILAATLDIHTAHYGCHKCYQIQKPLV